MRYTSLDHEILLPQKLLRMPWGLLVLLSLIGAIGVASLYSAGNGDFKIYALKHLILFAVSLGSAFMLALVDFRFWNRNAYQIFLGCLIVLVAVALVGFIGKGAQRWIALGPLQVQPSEFMKIGLILALAKYYADVSFHDLAYPKFLLPPLLMIGIPGLLILKQPNLGTALITFGVGAAISFAAGVRIWKFIAAGGLAAAAIPVAWHFLHDYQKGRVLTFLDPARDPLGAGYHIMQAKIAMGSGGLFGKGFMHGTQSHLSFLPEAQTDFIFTLIGEEWGFAGTAIVLLLYAALVFYGVLISLRARSQFGRLLALGLSFNMFMYLLINTGMVMGLMPVVGIPLPLISQGGSSLLAAMLGFGLLMSVEIHGDRHS